jgi:putative sigma-54 modulation protein
MEIHFTARHFNAPKALRDFAQAKISKLEKFYEGIIRCKVILTNEETSDHSRTVELTVKVYRLTLTSVVRTDDFEKGIVAAVQKVERQLKRYKSKLREKHKLQKHRTALAA